MKTRFLYILAVLGFFFLSGIKDSKAVEVTLTVDEFVTRPASLVAAEHNLAMVLSEINRAQKAKSILKTRGLPMDEFALKSLLRIWAVTPFYCDDEEVVEHCWVFKDGSMMVSHIPLIITPENDDFGMGAYQEAVVEFDFQGRITDFRFALDAHLCESLEHGGGVVDQEKKMVILQYVERFRTAYNQKDIDFIEKMFSDDALIITGKVVSVRRGGDFGGIVPKVEYTRQSKQEYIRNLKKAFDRNKWIDVKFSEIGEDVEVGCSAGITRSEEDHTRYGVRLRQEWNSSTYSDTGYLFLLWTFPEDGSDPCIEVRTWQPEWVGGKRQPPRDDISTLAGFNL